MKKQMIYGIIAALLLLAPSLQAQMPSGMAPAAAPVEQKKAPEKLFSQSFADTPLEMLVDFYNEWTGRTLIIQADLSPKITLKFSKLTKDEAMQAIETVLSMNGVALVPMGEKFLKVVPIANARQEGMEIRPFDQETEYTASDQLISQIVPLRYVVFSDVQDVIQHLIHGYGKVISMDRINSVLVTDTSANVARIVEVLAMIDQPLEKIEPRIYQLKYATSGNVAGKLKELVEAAKTPTSEQNVVAITRTVPGVIRARTTTGNGAGTVTGPSRDIGDDTQMIQGEIKFVSDDRTNILIIFSKEANFDFFDRIIKVLDVPVDPEVVVETINLEYAEAAEIAGILNDFVGAAAETEETKSTAADSDGGSKSLSEVINERAAPKREISDTAKNAIGRLSADTKIISDKRTNSLILMGRKSDIEALKVVVSSLDVMLQQVMIEAVILSVGLGDSFSTGVQWVYDTQEGTETATSQAVRTNTYVASSNTISGLITYGRDVIYDNVSEILPTRQLGGFDAAGLASNMVGGALSYYGSFPSLNVQAIINAAKTDSDARILSTPIVLTTDNTEAKITIADERPVITSSINSGSDNYSARATYEYKTIGIDLTVTPHINPQNFVLMEITQSADDVGGNVTVDGNEVPIIQKREISATVGVQDKETVVLGGLVRKSNSESTTKIPLLGDIPLLGWLFSSHSKSDDRQELVVLLTPYVLNNPSEATAEAQRRLDASDAKNTEWPRGWSLSELANDEPEADAWKNKKQKKQAEKAAKEAAEEAEEAGEEVEELEEIPVMQSLDS